MNDEQAQQMIMDKVYPLLEQFDSVRIICTLHKGGEEKSRIVSGGGGNFYAQLGSVSDWLEIQKQTLIDGVSE